MPLSNDTNIEKLVELLKVQPAIYDCLRANHMDMLDIHNIWLGTGKQMA